MVLSPHGNDTEMNEDERPRSLNIEHGPTPVLRCSSTSPAQRSVQLRRTVINCNKESSSQRPTRARLGLPSARKEGATFDWTDE